MQMLSVHSDADFPLVVKRVVHHIFEESERGPWFLSLYFLLTVVFSPLLRLHRHHKYGLKVVHKFGASCLWMKLLMSFGGWIED